MKKLLALLLLCVACDNSPVIPPEPTEDDASVADLGGVSGTAQALTGSMTCDAQGELQTYTNVVFGQAGHCVWRQLNPAPGERWIVECGTARYVYKYEQYGIARSGSRINSMRVDVYRRPKNPSTTPYTDYFRNIGKCDCSLNPVCRFPGMIIE